MLSAIGVVFVGFALTIWWSVRRNRADIAAGRGGYRPPPGTIAWGESASGGSGLATETRTTAGGPGGAREAWEARESR